MTRTAARIISFGICTACGAAFAAFALPELPDKAQGSILLLSALLPSAAAATRFCSAPCHTGAALAAQLLYYLAAPLFKR